MIVWFDEITAADVAGVGGKGANLGECVRAGLPVPPGFCVSTDAYREATHTLAGALAADAETDPAVARERIRRRPLPEAVRAAIAEAYARLGGGPVAVRSSATAEDQADASFAGQQDSYLGVTGLDAVLDAVRRCWASLWTDRAVDYRRRQGVASDGLALAVVIQAMVAADTAGVLFTRDPVTGDDATMLVNASYGLGESVVAALVTPDTFTLARRPASVTARAIGSKRTRIDPAPGGGTRTREVPDADRSRPSLTDAQLLRLAGLGERVERHYGSGHDIEWAFSGGELFLLQARPITTTTTTTTTAVGVAQGHPPTRGRLQRLLRDDLIEHFPAPFPLDLLAARAVVAGAADAVGLPADRASALLAGDEDGIIRVRASDLRGGSAVLLGLPGTIRRGLRHDPFGWPTEERALRKHLDALAATASDAAHLPDADVLGLVRAALGQARAITTLRFARWLVPMMVNRGIADLLLRASGLGRDVTPEDLFAGVPYRTAEITAAVVDLAADARGRCLAGLIADAPPGGVGAALAACSQGRAFLSRVEAFLAAHGARTARLYLPFSHRSWREDPEAFCALLAATLRADKRERARTPDAAPVVERRLPRLLRRCWRRNTDELRARHIAREATVYLIEEFFCLARAGTDEIARRLVARGQLERPGDLCFLYVDEVEAALGDRQPRHAIVDRRRRRRGTAEALWWDRGETVPDGPVLRGLPSAAGRAAGAARIIRSPEDFGRLLPGDILVCPSTDPSWTPLFALAAGVVADSGGPLSHAAIVAREYGIPAVLGAGRATGLPDGVRVIVDGGAGTVTLAGDPGR